MEELRGARTAGHLTEKIKAEIETMGTVPCLCIVRVGEDPSDLSYERGAVKRMEKCGIRTVLKNYPSDIDHETFSKAFRETVNDPDIDGILLMRPLPKQIDSEEIMRIMDPSKDVDCITGENLEKVFEGNAHFYPCTARAVMEMIHDAGIDVSGKKAVVIGRSMVVGKPLSMMLLSENATVTICHSRTKDLPSVCREADILVAAIGRAEMVDDTYVKEGAYVFDVGINVNAEGKLTGDCDYEKISEKACGATPVPGGVGSVTTAVLALHTLEACKLRRG